MRLALLSAITVGCFGACRPQLLTYQQPSPVDTETRPVRLLRDTVFTTASGVLAKADFPGARLASFSESGTDTLGNALYVAEIPAENQPINPSPWFAFHLSAPTEREITVRLTYPRGRRQPLPAEDGTSHQRTVLLPADVEL